MNSALIAVYDDLDTRVRKLSSNLNTIELKHGRDGKDGSKYFTIPD